MCIRDSFNTDGEMRYGWFEDNGDWYYLGTEDEGWRTDAKWLWLEEPNEDDEDNDSMPSHDDDCSLCDSEGWYYFQNDGKAYRDNSKKKKINGKYYYFNEHGQMLYEWINTCLLYTSYLHEVCPAMAALRKPADELEMLVDKELWPFPSYGDLVFEV